MTPYFHDVCWGSCDTCSPIGSSENIELNDIIIFPNPTSSFLTIKSYNLISPISIYDITGKLVLQNRGNSKEIILDISNLNSGLYFIKSNCGLMLKSNILNNLKTRGFINDCTDLMGLDNLLSTSKVTCYIGYDATASSLHVGHLMNIMMLRWFQKDGHRVITLLGGGTTKIGDPSFRKTERPLITDESINANLLSLKSIFSKYLNFSSDFPGAIMLNNDEWLSKLNYLDFLRDTGKHFSINRMLSFESVKSRLQKNDPLSFLEFNYMILQGYDFYKLNHDYQCILQMGGSDQWGNIVNGIELTRRMNSNKLFGLTSPLLTNSSGQKMGKSSSGAVWLNQENLSPYEFWQFWRNCEDDDIQKFLLLFTEFSIEKIKELTARKGHRT